MLTLKLPLLELKTLLWHKSTKKLCIPVFTWRNFWYNFFHVCLGQCYCLVSSYMKYCDLTYLIATWHFNQSSKVISGYDCVLLKQFPVFWGWNSSCWSTPLMGSYHLTSANIFSYFLSCPFLTYFLSSKWSLSLIFLCVSCVYLSTCHFLNLKYSFSPY